MSMKVHEGGAGAPAKQCLITLWCRVIALAHRQLPGDSTAAALRSMARADAERDLQLAGFAVLQVRVVLDRGLAAGQCKQIGNVLLHEAPKVCVPYTPACSRYFEWQISRNN